MKKLISAFLLCSSSSFCGLTEEGNFKLDSFKDVQMVLDNVGEIISEFRWRIICLEHENALLKKEIEDLKKQNTKN